MRLRKLRNTLLTINRLRLSMFYLRNLESTKPGLHIVLLFAKQCKTIVVIMT